MSNGYRILIDRETLGFALYQAWNASEVAERGQYVVEGVTAAEAFDSPIEALRRYAEFIERGLPGDSFSSAVEDEEERDAREIRAAGLVAISEARGDADVLERVVVPVMGKRPKGTPEEVEAAREALQRLHDLKGKGEGVTAEYLELNCEVGDALDRLSGWQGFRVRASIG